MFSRILKEEIIASAPAWTICANMVTPAPSKVLQDKLLQISKQRIHLEKFGRGSIIIKIIRHTLHDMEATNTYMPLFSSSSQTVRKPDPNSANRMVNTQLL